MRTALLDLPSQSLTSVLEPRFRRLGRKLILRIAFGKVGGSIPQSNSTKIAVVFTTAIFVELLPKERSRRRSMVSTLRQRRYDHRDHYDEIRIFEPLAITGL